MKLQAVELISRYTQTTSRLLLVSSAGLFGLEWYDLNSKPWEFMDRSVAPDEFREIATAVLVFLLVSHLIHWVVDHQTYKKWFQTNAVPTGSLEALGSFKKTSMPTLDSLFRRLEHLAKNLKQAETLLNETDVGPPTNDDGRTKLESHIKRTIKDVERCIEQDKRIERDLTEVQSLLSDIGPGLREVSRLGWFVIYVWYLTFPVSACGTALVILWLC